MPPGEVPGVTLGGVHMGQPEEMFPPRDTDFTSIQEKGITVPGRQAWGLWEPEYGLGSPGHRPTAWPIRLAGVWEVGLQGTCKPPPHPLLPLLNVRLSPRLYLTGTVLMKDSHSRNHSKNCRIKHLVKNE